MAVRKFCDGWQADFYDPSGKRVRKVFPTKKEARDFEGKMRAMIRENRYFDVHREHFKTFSQMLDWYFDLPDTRRQKSLRSLEYISKPVREFFGKDAVDKITPEMIQEYVDSRIALPTWMEKQRARGSVNREIAFIKRIEEAGPGEGNPSQA